MNRETLIRVLGSAVITGGILAGCTPAVPVDPAPYAADPGCARIMLAIPTELGGLSLRPTTSQATAVWGEEFAIVARCGVELPGPTPDACLRVETTLTWADWILREGDEEWTAVSYGLTPAVEVTVPKIRADKAIGDLLVELTPATARADSTGVACS